MEEKIQQLMSTSEHYAIGQMIQELLDRIEVLEDKINNKPLTDGE